MFPVSAFAAPEGSVYVTEEMPNEVIEEEEQEGADDSENPEDEASLPEMEEEYYYYIDEEESEEEEEDAAEEALIGIMPLSMYRPVGVPDVPASAYFVVGNEAQLRSALSSTANPRVIRLENDITLTTAAVLPHSGASTTVHIYSNSAESFSINRGTSTSRHFTMAGSRVLHLWNVALTRDPGMTTYGGGILMDASGTRLHMHAGSEISHNRASGRGGGINVSSGIATLNAGALIDNNASNHASAAGGSSGGGGGVSISNGATVYVNGATISNNVALRGHGGGIQVGAGTTGGRARLNINGIQLLNNTAHRNAAGTQGGSLGNFG
jgi:hypothetical protein